MGWLMKKGSYIQLRMNNEIELCEVADIATKDIVEKALIQNRISYFINWQRTGIFRSGKEVGIFCINENHKEEAERIIQDLGPNIKVKFI